MGAYDKGVSAPSEETASSASSHTYQPMIASPLTKVHPNVADAQNSSKYRPDIDGLRAIAVGAVVTYRTGIPGVRGGFTGVDVFFVISGFLITGLLLSDLKRYHRIRLTHFLARRVRRILPTLILVILVTVVAGSFLLSPVLGETQRLSHAAAATLLISANFYFLRESRNYSSTASDFQPLLHTWSLSVEEQFYLLWPAVLMIAYRMSARFKTPMLFFAMTIGLLCVLSAACAVALALWRDNWAFYLTPARGWELGSGGLVAIISPSIQGVTRRWALIASAIGLALVVIGIAAVPADRSSPLLIAIFPVLGACLIIFGNTVCPDGTVGRLLSTRWLVQVGLVSYAWYLWHWPALSFARIIALGQPDLLRDCLISLAILALLWQFRGTF